MDILLIEDEQLAGEKLRGYIKEFIDPNTKITWLRSISEVREFLSSGTHVDLIFSDIELLDGNVFSIYDSVKIASPIIFCTAYSVCLESVQSKRNSLSIKTIQRRTVS